MLVGDAEKFHLHYSEGLQLGNSGDSRLEQQRGSYRQEGKRRKESRDQAVRLAYLAEPFPITPSNNDDRRGKNRKA